MKIVFATNNKGKLQEVQGLLKHRKDLEILSLKDLDFEGELQETGSTFEDNASQKANYIYEKYGLDCFADDSGLEVEAIGGQPGVHSARYAGPQRNDEDNVKRLLREMYGESNRNARFRTVIAFVRGGLERHFEGTVEGRISEVASGSNGFGYDPVFVPSGHHKTFAEMSFEEKNAISHRSKAVHKLVDFLNSLKPSEAL